MRRISQTTHSSPRMIIVIITLLGWWIFSLKAALIYLGIVGGGTLLMSWRAAFSPNGNAPNASREEQQEVFRTLLFGAVVGIPWFPLDLVAIVASLAFHYSTK